MSKPEVITRVHDGVLYRPFESLQEVVDNFGRYVVRRNNEPNTLAVRTLFAADKDLNGTVYLHLFGCVSTLQEAFEQFEFLVEDMKTVPVGMAIGNYGPYEMCPCWMTVTPDPSILGVGAVYEFNNSPYEPWKVGQYKGILFNGYQAIIGDEDEIKLFKYVRPVGFSGFENDLLVNLNGVVDTSGVHTTKRWSCNQPNVSNVGTSEDSNKLWVPEPNEWGAKPGEQLKEVTTGSCTVQYEPKPNPWSLIPEEIVTLGKFFGMTDEDDFDFTFEWRQKDGEVTNKFDLYHKRHHLGMGTALPTEENSPCLFTLSRKEERKNLGRLFVKGNKIRREFTGSSYIDVLESERRKECIHIFINGLWTANVDATSGRPVRISLAPHRKYIDLYEIKQIETHTWQD